MITGERVILKKICPVGYPDTAHLPIVFSKGEQKKTESWDSCLWETRSDTENHGKKWWDFRDENCPPEQFRLSKILPCLFAMRRSGSQGVWKFAVAKFDEYLHRLKVSKNYMSKQLSKRRLVQKLLANMSVLFLFTLLFDPWRKWILLKIEGMIFSHLAISVEEVKKFLPHSCVGIDTSTFTKRKEDHFLYWDLNSFAENPDWFCVIPCLVVFFHLSATVTLLWFVEKNPTARCWKWLLHRFVPCSTDSFRWLHPGGVLCITCPTEILNIQIVIVILNPSKFEWMLQPKVMKSLVCSHKISRSRKFSEKLWSS